MARAVSKSRSVEPIVVPRNEAPRTGSAAMVSVMRVSPRVVEWASPGDPTQLRHPGSVNDALGGLTRLNGLVRVERPVGDRQLVHHVGQRPAQRGARALR